MSQQKVGLVGWRGMVGSVLMQRKKSKISRTLSPPFSLPLKRVLQHQILLAKMQVF